MINTNQCIYKRRKFEEERRKFEESFDILRRVHANSLNIVLLCWRGYMHQIVLGQIFHHQQLIVLTYKTALQRHKNQIHKQ